MVVSLANLQIIKIKDCIDKNLSLRFYADDFFNFIEQLEQKDLIVDFDGINSVSRSFAQQFLCRLNQCNRNVKIVNQSEETIKLFEAVNSPRKKVVIA